MNGLIVSECRRTVPQRQVQRRACKPHSNPTKQLQVSYEQRIPTSQLYQVVPQINTMKSVGQHAHLNKRQEYVIRRCKQNSAAEGAPANDGNEAKQPNDLKMSSDTKNMNLETDDVSEYQFSFDEDDEIVEFDDFVVKQQTVDQVNEQLLPEEDNEVLFAFKDDPVDTVDESNTITNNQNLYNIDDLYEDDDDDIELNFSQVAPSLAQASSLSPAEQPEDSFDSSDEDSWVNTRQNRNAVVADSLEDEDEDGDVDFSSLLNLKDGVQFQETSGPSSLVNEFSAQGDSSYDSDDLNDEDFGLAGPQPHEQYFEQQVVGAGQEMAGQRDEVEQLSARGVSDSDGGGVGEESDGGGVGGGGNNLEYLSDLLTAAAKVEQAPKRRGQRRWTRHLALNQDNDLDLDLNRISNRKLQALAKQGVFKYIPTRKPEPFDFGTGAEVEMAEYIASNLNIKLSRSNKKWLLFFAKQANIRFKESKLRAATLPQRLSPSNPDKEDQKQAKIEHELYSVRDSWLGPMEPNMMQAMRVVAFLQQCRLHTKKYRKYVFSILKNFPEILTYDIQGTCIPYTSCLLSLGIRHHIVTQAVVSFPPIMLQPLQNAREGIEYFREFGFDPYQLSELVQHSPKTVLRSTRPILQRKLEYIKYANNIQSDRKAMERLFSSLTATRQNMKYYDQDEGHFLRGQQYVVKEHEVEFHPGGSKAKLLRGGQDEEGRGGVRVRQQQEETRQQPKQALAVGEVGDFDPNDEFTEEMIL